MKLLCVRTAEFLAAVIGVVSALMGAFYIEQIPLFASLMIMLGIFLVPIGVIMLVNSMC